MVDLNFLVLTAAANLFVIALGALLVWEFRTFFGGQSTSGFMRPRAKRLGVVETARSTPSGDCCWCRDEVKHLGHGRRPGRYADRGRH